MIGPEIGATAAPVARSRRSVADATPLAPVCRNPAFAGASVPDLMRLHGGIQAELQARGVVRTANGPVGDYAEYVFARAFGWTLAGNSEGAFDATDAAGLRYQIKGRRLATAKTARQLGAIRRLPEGGFHQLAVVLFDAGLTVHRAALIPYPLVVERARFIALTNSWRPMVPDKLWSLPAVADVTVDLRRAEAEEA